MMEWLRNPKRIKKKCMLMLLVIVIGEVSPLQLKASQEVQDNPIEKEEIYINLERSEDRLEEGMLCVPDTFLQELRIYYWISEAVEYRASESGDDEIFYCNLKEDVLYGGRNRGFGVSELQDLKVWEYLVKQENAVKFAQNDYQLKVEGTKENLYAALDLGKEVLRLYPEEKVIIYDSNDRFEVYDQIKVNENNEIEYYPDFYVESDWDDMEVVDDHFAGVSLDELQSLDYLKFPDDLYCYQSIYLSVSSILKRYMEEHHIEDVFYFDAEKDIIASVTNMIFTCRLRGENQTLYIDIDAYNMKCHVYEMEN